MSMRWGWSIGRVMRARKFGHRRGRGRERLVGAERCEPRALLTVTLGDPILSDTVEIDDNVIVQDGSRSITATGGPGTSGYVQIFGNSKGRIDGSPGESDEDLTIDADGFITVTGGIGGIQRLDDLTLSSATAQPISLQQVVSLTGDLTVTKAGSFTVGSTVTIDGDLVIDEAAMVTFSGNVSVGGDLTITQATGVTFAGTLSVGGSLTIVSATGTTRFAGDVRVGAASITSTTLVQIQGDFTTTGLAGDGDVTLTTDQINFTTASLGADPAATDATLVIRPWTASRALTIASPPGIPAGMNITDADILAIQPGWKRVVMGDEAAGTGAVRIGSIGSQYGGFSQLLNTTTIVGGTVQVVQPVDVTTLATYLEIIARGTGSPGSGSMIIDAPINQTEGERCAWVRLESAGSIAINAPVWADQIVSLTTTVGGTIAQGGTAAAINTTALAVDADGAVTLADSGNAFALVAIKTTNDSVMLREDSGYSISQVTTIDDGRDSRPSATVTGIDTGTATVRLVTVSGNTASTVGQGRAILAGGLGLEGAGTDWSLSLATNDIGTLAADTGSIVFRDVDDLTIDTVAAVSPRAALSGITVARTLDAIAGATLAITAAGDILSAASSGTAVNLEASSGISTAGDVITAGGNVEFDHATTLTGDVVLDLEDGPNRGLVTFADAVNGTASGHESLTIGGDLDASASIGSAVALESLSVSGDSTLAGGIMLRTTGNQTYSGAALSTGTITIQAGKNSSVGFLGDVSIGGLVTGTADTAAYDVSLTGGNVSVAAVVAFANTGTVTLGDADTDSLTFAGGLASTAPSLTSLAGTIATTNKDASFGVTTLTADTTVATGSGGVNFTAAVDGPHALSVNAQGTTAFGGAVGGVLPLAALVTDAGGQTRIDGGRITTSTPLMLASSADGGVGRLVSSGQFYNDGVVLGADAVLTAGLLTTMPLVAVDGDTIEFASTVDGGYGLTVNTAGTTTFAGAVGGSVALASLATDAAGTTFVGGLLVRTTGGQAYADRLEFEPPAGVASVGAASVAVAPETRLIAGTVSTLAGLSGGGHDLVIEGDAVFGGSPPITSASDDADPVDPVQDLSSLRVTGTTTVYSTLIQSSGVQTYESAVTLAGDLVVQCGGAVFESTITGGGRALEVIHSGGLVRFDGDVGSTDAPLGTVGVISFTGSIQLNAGMHSTGPVLLQTVFGSVDGGPDNAIHAPASKVGLAGMGSIGGTHPIAIEAAGVAAMSFAGDIRLRGIGDLVLEDPGLVAMGGAIDLDASGEIRVPAGRTIQAQNGVTTSKPIHWVVDSVEDAGVGSLRSVLDNVNAVGDCHAGGLDAVLVFERQAPANGQQAPMLIRLASQLPDVAASVRIDGTEVALVLDGGQAVSSGLVFGAAAAGSELTRVTLRNFSGFAVQMVGVRDMTIDTILVQGLNTTTSMGLLATGDLTGSRVVASTFTGGLRGALFDGARGLVFGEIGRGNLLSQNRAAPSQPKYAGTGVRAQGDCTGTVVRGNTFTGNNYGFAFMGARGLALQSNLFTSNGIAGIYIEGDSSGSTQSENAFGRGRDRNKVNIRRAPKSKFGVQPPVPSRPRG